MLDEALRNLEQMPPLKLFAMIIEVGIVSVIGLWALFRPIRETKHDREMEKKLTRKLLQIGNITVTPYKIIGITLAILIAVLLIVCEKLDI